MSDISGYRSDGGGLGQDQGVSKQLRSILTAKLPLLSAPGTVLENSLYYDINSSSVTAVEEQATFNKDRISLNNPTIGSTPSAYIPSVLFAGSVFWVAKLPDAVYTAQDATAVITIPLGWGFWALNSIIVYMGASSIAQIQISGYSNFLIAMACCETLRKRNEILLGAGQLLDNASSASPMAGAVTGQSIWKRKSLNSLFIASATGVPDRTLAQCTVPLRLPWSSLSVLEKRLSLDTKLSTQPIQITLQTRQLNEIAHYGAGVNWANQQFEYTTIQIWQEELSDKSLSVRNELLAMPEFNVGYPFQYAQSIDFDVAAQGQDNGTTSQDFTMNITSIINSDLTTFLFNVTWAGRQDPDNGQFCPLYGEKLQNIELLLNGQRFFAFDDVDYPIVTMAKQVDYPLNWTFINTQNSLPGIANGNYYQTESYFYEFNNSRLRSIIAESHLQNTARFTNQTFQLRFNINRDINYLLPASNPPGPTKYSKTTAFNSGYVLHMTYLYNAVYLVGGDGGTTKLITN